MLDFAVDWSAQMALDSDSISASSWHVDAGITVDDDSQFTATRGVIWLSGGDAGNTYQVTNEIQTTGGRTWERTLEIIVQER